MVYRGSMARRLIWLPTLRRGSYPPATQESLPAAGPALPDGIGYPQGSLRKVSSLEAILLSWTYLAQGQIRLTVRKTGGQLVLGLSDERAKTGPGPAKPSGPARPSATW